jgi:hypothetical protein
MEPLGIKEIPKDIEKQVASWAWIAGSLRVLFLLLVLSSIGCSLVVSTFTEELALHHVYILKIFGFVAALSTSLLAGLDIAGKANKFRRAIRLFTGARARFQTLDNYDAGALISAYESAEELIGDVNYIPQKTTGESSEEKREGG